MNSQQTLHYGGSLRNVNSSTPGLSPRPAQKTRYGSFNAQKRFELIARMENVGLSEAAIAPMLNLSVSRLRYLKKLPEYLVVRMRITHGIILDQDAKITEIKEQRKELLVQLLPPALQALGNTLLSQPQNYADRKLQIDVAKDVLDRSDIFAKVSRTEIKPVSFFDFEKTDRDSEEVLKALKGAALAAQEGRTLAVQVATQDIEATLNTHREFTSGAPLSENEQQDALASLEMDTDSAGSD